MNLTTRKWEVFEISLQSNPGQNPFLDVSLSAEFTHAQDKVLVHGFFDGGDEFKIRFMPGVEGIWTYVTHSNVPALDGQTGQFECSAAAANTHGVVRVKNTFHFAYQDGTPFYPVGTTCYAWIYQSDERQLQTLETLKNSGFNKIRMCAFPKYYDYNRALPAIYPYVGNEETGFDPYRPNPAFFQLLDQRVKELAELGIEADLILFHPYEKPTWGFNLMGKKAGQRWATKLGGSAVSYRIVSVS